MSSGLGGQTATLALQNVEKSHLILFLGSGMQKTKYLANLNTKQVVCTLWHKF